MLIRTLLSSLVITIVILKSNANDYCTTPGGLVGKCVLIKYCPVLFDASQKKRLTKREREILTLAQCGNQGVTPKVCCDDIKQSDPNEPIPCRTHDTNAPGTCMAIRSCKPLFQLLRQRPLTDPAREYLHLAYCGETDTKTPKVCCPNMAPTERTTHRPVPEIETGNGLTPKSPLLPAECGAESTHSNVVGGEVADLDEYPWMVLLGFAKNPEEELNLACGGMIISKRYVLTAAHCFTEKAIKEVGTLVSVRVGEYDTSKDVDCVPNQGCNTGFTEDLSVEETTLHPGYNQEDTVKYNDIALIRVNQDIHFNDFVKPICLPNKGVVPKADDHIFVAGWGRTGPDSLGSKIKMKLTIPTLPMDACQSQYELALRGSKLSGELQFCAGGEAGKDTCQGDSGGPAMKLEIDTKDGWTDPKWICMGVVSFGPQECGIKGVPGIYTKVSAHINWILSTMRP